MESNAIKYSKTSCIHKHGLSEYNETMLMTIFPLFKNRQNVFAKHNPQWQYVIQNVQLNSDHNFINEYNFSRDHY